MILLLLLICVTVFSSFCFLLVHGLCIAIYLSFRTMCSFPAIYYLFLGFPLSVSSFIVINAFVLSLTFILLLYAGYIH
uniref:Uncharacterized protein n=1 Tax=Rhizophora mucronata TaxID=61149 RepID=A0A2P2PQI8_RHIMU